MAYYKADDENIDVKSGEKITINNQTWAANIVSKAWLEKIPQNLEENGEMMYHFIADIGDIFRERLLNHPTEPEALTVSLIDPFSLEKFSTLDRLLLHSIRESILYARKETSAMKPSISSQPRFKEFILNRIYAPVLGLSYRTRWTRSCFFTAKELNDLLDPLSRKPTKNKLMKMQKGKSERDSIEKTHQLEDFIEEKENEQDS